MLTTKKVGNVSFTASTNGAELHSIKIGDEEYLWQCGDAWKRYAPILFPFICSPSGKTYKADGKEYHMPGNHGFARDSEFTLVGETDHSVTYELTSDETTLEWYPYDFRLEVSYSIAAGRVFCSFMVTNTGKKDMYFYLGGHPAFACDIEGGKCMVRYEQAETIVQPTPDGERTILDHERVIELTRDLFKYDVIMKDAPESKEITLLRDDGGFVRVYFPNSECIAVWTATDPAAQFICLEPWTSVPVYADDEFEDIEKKPHAIRLAPDEEHYYTFSIEAGKHKCGQ
ncbi:Galactose mutarotase [Ruminococcus sp. YE71]|uniref:aldose epimerase family protein n=1 Tax=unclassified Ruminococcus TaxID=2608920 RepID=UPI000882A832|nr:MULTISPECIES: hypothetical protein [unclassified Ruminococcus]SDA25292.1 Galactose mutarotase [Ruminococcus sp. YE78]SFW42709.1 Galactose mutarotase [Ruminococcus sp. YE71]